MTVHSNTLTPRARHGGARGARAWLGATLLAALIGCSGPEPAPFELPESEYDIQREQKRALLSGLENAMLTIANGERPTSIQPGTTNLTPDILGWAGATGGGMPKVCETEPNPDACWGADVAKGNCAQCHSTDGSPGSGPTWAGLFGAQRIVMDGAGTKLTVVADEEYIRESIVNPNAKIVMDYMEGQAMASQAHLKPEQVDALVAFIKTLGGGKAP